MEKEGKRRVDKGKEERKEKEREGRRGGRGGGEGRGWEQRGEDGRGLTNKRGDIRTNTGLVFF